MTLAVDFDPAKPAPNRLVARLRARHAVREAAAVGLPPQADELPGLALYPRPVEAGGEEEWLDRLLAAVQQAPREGAYHRVLRRLGL